MDHEGDGEGYPRRTGIRELARHLDVSIGTVSRALNGRSDVNPQTRQRVAEAAAELGYVPNHSGRSLRQGSTKTVGVVWHIINGGESYGEPFFIGLFSGIHAALRHHDHDLVVLLSQDEDERERIRRVIERGLVDALILPWTRSEDPRLDEVAERRFPFVTLGRSRSGGEHDWIDLDFHQMALDSTRRLVGFGHRRIALAVAGDDLMQGSVFLGGYRQALAEAGLPFDPALVAAGDLSVESGYHAMSSLMTIDPQPTGVVFISHNMALGGYRRLAELQLVPGRDVAIVGGAMDAAVCQMMTPPLTCYDLSTFDLGVRLGEVTMARLSQGRTGRPVPPCQELWPLRLVERQSDGPHRA